MQEVASQGAKLHCLRPSSTWRPGHQWGLGLTQVRGHVRLYQGTRKREEDMHASHGSEDSPRACKMTFLLDSSSSPSITFRKAASFPTKSSFAAAYSLAGKPNLLSVCIQLLSS